MYGTSKEYPPLYSSFYTDSDVKGYLRTIRQHQRESFVSDVLEKNNKQIFRYRKIFFQPCKTDLEKQICLDELTFHMRPQKRIVNINQFHKKPIFITV